MKTIKIKTQAQFDKLPAKFKFYTKIQIVGNVYSLNRTPEYSFISVSDSATIKYVSGSATIKSVYDSATIEYVYDSATIEYVSGSATIKSVSGSATIKSVYDSATIESVYDSATIKSVSGSATIEYVYDSATIEYVSMNVIIRVMNEGIKILEARQQVVIIYQGCKGKPKKYDKTVTIKHTVKADFNLINFINIYGVKKTKTKLTLYKFVQSNFTDFYTGKVKYKIGKVVECPGWDSNLNNECGGGLHLSPSINYCKRFNDSKDGHALKCEVAIKDIVVHPNPQYPYKVRCRKTKVLEEIKE